MDLALSAGKVGDSPRPVQQSVNLSPTVPSCPSFSPIVSLPPHFSLSTFHFSLLIFNFPIVIVLQQFEDIRLPVVTLPTHPRVWEKPVDAPSLQRARGNMHFQEHVLPVDPVRPFG